MVNLDNLFARIQECGLTPKKVSDATGISTGNISDWKKGRSMPSAIKLDVLADYLNCSVDYLLGRTDVPDGVVSFPDQRPDTMLSDLTDSYSALNQEGREKLTDYADDLVTSGKYKKIDPAELGQKKG